MNIKKLTRNAVQSTEKANKRLTTLSEEELSKVVAGLVACTCAYAYATTMMTLTTNYQG